MINIIQQLRTSQKSNSGTKPDLNPSNNLEEGDSDTDTDPSPGPSIISGRSSKVKGSTNKEENKVPNAEE